MISYEGIFFDEETEKYIHSLETKILFNTNDKIHCTFKYHPLKEELIDEIIGQEVEVYLIGYGNNGQNSGFQITFPSIFNKYYINYDIKDNEEPKLKIPHLTASLALNAKACDTMYLNFIPLETPIKVIGRFGYWIKEGNKEYVTYMSYSQSN